MRMHVEPEVNHFSRAICLILKQGFSLGLRAYQFILGGWPVSYQDLPVAAFQYWVQAHIYPRLYLGISKYIITICLDHVLHTHTQSQC